ncbi:hypothetical protein J3998_09915 [Thiomicrorhabdus sp. 6S2-11]|uniref:Porin n=1 Tax=Thiomicrorhabdus marina TaxID=2818442 RepID=A0ABS3Q6J1_9GAMM|nr:hypothetical protein [Thiomicrorhabdus marina]MBO1927891.1 hypothetical protein [Thiomicrorhabdus marina]
MKQHLSKFLFPLLSFTALNVSAADYQVYFEVEGFNHSEPMAIFEFAGDWQGQLYNGDQAISLNRAEIGFSKDQWSLGLFVRSDMLLEFPGDTAEFYYLAVNQLPIETDRVYDINIDTNFFTATGLKLGYQGRWQKFDWQLDLSYLQAHRMTYGSYQSTAEYDSNADYHLALDVDYYYDNDVLFDRDVQQKPEGHGYAIDFAVGGQVTENWSAGLAVKDLFAAIYWDQAPRTIYTGEAVRGSGDNLFEYTTNSGLESNEHLTQDIPAKVFVNSEYRFFENHRIRFDYNYYAIKGFFSSSYLYQYGTHNFRIGYNLSAEAIELGYNNDWLKVQLIADEFNPNTARTLAGALSVYYRF